LGLFLLLFGGWILLPRALRAGTVHLWASLAFIASGCLLFLTSSTYHFLNDSFEISPRLELFFENLDHYCIYLFIAGTYSPVLLNVLAEPWRHRLLCLIWISTLLGILYTKIKPILFKHFQSRIFYTGIFLLMGLTFLIRLPEIYSKMTFWQWDLLSGGAAIYCLGAGVYVTKRPVLFRKYFGYHEVWHLLILFAATLHFLLILSFY
jgi:hemolysin III